MRKDQSPLHRAIHYALVVRDVRPDAPLPRLVPDHDRQDGLRHGRLGRLAADRRYVTLRHEAVHLRQFRKLTLPVMAVLYLQTHSAHAGIVELDNREGESIFVEAVK